MKKTVLVIGVTLIASFMILGCGGGGDDEASSVGNLAGTWLGVIENLSGSFHKFSMQMDSAGNVTALVIDDVNTGETGRISEDWDFFHVFYDFNSGSTSPLTRGTLIVDPGYRYATYADEALYVGVLQKGATSLPPYASSDIIGSYNGGAYEFTVDSQGTWNWDGEGITMTVDNTLAFTGNSSSGAFSGGFNPTLRSSTYGGYMGSMDVPVYGTMDIYALVSPDKNGVAAYAKAMGTSPSSIQDYILIGLVR